MQKTHPRPGRRSLGILPRRRVALAFAALFGATSSVSVLAQGPIGAAPADRILLGDLYAQVKRANPRAAAARFLAGASAARVAAATRPPDPQLQFGFMNYSIPRLAPMATVGMAQLQVMQMFPLGGKLALSGRAAGDQASATAARAQDVEWDVRTQAAMAFYELYATDRSLDVARETIRLLHDVATTTQSMYRLGAGRQTDVLRANVEIATMAEDTLRMAAMRESMVAKLNALLDRDTENRVATPALPQFPDVLPARAWLDSIAFAQRPLVRAGVDEVSAADASEKLARKQIIPDLAIGVQYAQRGGEMGIERMGSLMFGASLPVFARDRQFRMREEAAAMKLMARADLAATRAETRGQIGEAYAALMRARNLAQLYRTTVLPQADATVASALAAYRVGSVDFMTLLDDYTTVNKYRQELVTLDADQGKAWAELEMLTGRELIDPRVTQNEIAAEARPAGGAK